MPEQPSVIVPDTARATERSRRVFISFASEDLDLANHIVDSLERAAIPCWIAHRDIGLGESYPAAIGMALEESGAVLLLLTPHANRSPHVRREIEMAFNAGTPILPVRMSGILPSPDLQYFLSTTQWLDAGATFDESEALRLRLVLQKLLDRQPIDGSWGRSQWRRRAAMAVGGGAVTIAIALLVWATVWRDREATGARPPEGTRATVPPGAPAGPSERPPVGREDDTRTSADIAVTKLNPRDGQPYVWVPPGSFTMGCSSGDPACADDERPVHAVTIRNGFWLGRTEVTVGQYARRPAGGGMPPGTDEPDLPASSVTWAEAREYCTTVGGRLPTEAEWEYAARAGTSTRFYGAPADVAWYEANSDGRPHPVGMKMPNALGLYDMLGNVAEWVRDRYYNAYDDSGEETTIEEPLAPHASAVARGGSWFSETSGIRVSRRLDMFPDAAEPIIGFRCAIDKL